ncbi:hypothetical protein OHA46_33265 (plasmid) [Streptomyces sp. NBC_00708]
MSPHQSHANRLGPKEKTALAITTVFFTAAVTLVALGLPVTDILILMGGTAGAAVLTVSTITFAGTLRAASETAAALVRISAHQP